MDMDQALDSDPLIEVGIGIEKFQNRNYKSSNTSLYYCAQQISLEKVE